MKYHKCGKDILANTTFVVCALCMLLCTGCVSFPTLHPHLLTMKNNICTYYPVIKQDSCSVTFGPGQEKPISECDGFYAVPPEDVTALLEWQKQQCGNK